MYENKHKFVVEEPEHYKYLPPDLYDFKKGQCVVDIQIEKPKNNHQVIGGFNDWKLPRRIESTIPFTQNKAKVSNNGSLVAIPHAPQIVFNTDFQSKLMIELSIPSDEYIFSCLILKNILTDENDMRHCLKRDNKYEDMALSDKGQKHRGVISLFDDELSSASILSNAYWRKIVRGSVNKSKLTFSIDKLETIVSQYSLKDLSHITEGMRFSHVGLTKKYLKNNLKDTIEYLIHQGVLIQQYKWRCLYCGNDNTHTLDTVKIENHCSVCKKSHKTPIDMKWEYKVSPFIISALCEQNGLTVLWAISYLLDGFKSAQSIYLPEIDLYKKHDNKEKNEIDLLAIIDGQFVAAEVKLSVASFVSQNNEIESFVDETVRLEPDIVYLVFEQYCHNEDETEKFKSELKSTIRNIKEKIPIHTELKVVIASEITDFHKVPFELGPYGNRTHEFLDKLND